MGIIGLIIPSVLSANQGWAANPYNPRNSTTNGNWTPNVSYSTVLEDDTLPDSEIQNEVTFTPGHPPPSYTPTYTPRPQYQPQTYRPPQRTNDAGLFSHYIRSTPLNMTLRGGDSGVTVDGCSSALKFINLRRRCTTFTMSSTFFRFAAKNIPACVNHALRAVGRSSAKTINTINMKDYNVASIANSPSSLSLHGTGRAIDIGGFEAELMDGSRFSASMMTPSGQRSHFSQSFLSCWRAAVYQDQPSCPRRSRTSGKHMWGVITCDEDPRHHHNHFHLSLPFCPGKPGIAGT